MKIYDVWAEWCPPCKKFGPIFESVSKEFPGVDFVKINADENPDFLNKFSIRGIPTILLTTDSGDILFQHAGILSAENLRKLVSLHFCRAINRGGYLL